MCYATEEITKSNGIDNPVFTAYGGQRRKFSGRVDIYPTRGLREAELDKMGWIKDSVLSSNVPGYNISNSITSLYLTNKGKADYNSDISKGSMTQRWCFNPVHHVKMMKGFLVDETSAGNLYGSDQPRQEAVTGMQSYKDIISIVDYKIGLINPLDGYMAPVLNYTAANNNLPLKVDINYSDLIIGFSRLAPSIEKAMGGKLSIANFILELRDLRRLSGLFSTKYADIASAAGDKHLGVNFGVLPLVGDIELILNGISRMEKFINRWNALANKQAVVTFKTTLLEEEGSWTGPTSSVHHGGVTDEWQSEIFWKRLAKMHVYAVPKRISLTSGMMRAKARAYGLDQPLSVIWEAIPFSFVIDWFLGIQEVIGNYEKSSSIFDYDIVDGGYSTLIEYSATSDGIRTVESQLAAYGVGPDRETLATYADVNKTYTRHRIDHSTLVGLKIRSRDGEWSVSGLSPHQTSLGLALWHTRR